jgi:hypothetical protein
LLELLHKICQVDTSHLQQDIAAAATLPPSPERQWFESILSEGGLVDAFRYFHPHAQDRFTCFHQYENKRYCNEGTRIDYTLVDSKLVSYLVKGMDYDDSAAAALADVTAQGRFPSGTFHGGGIPDVPQPVLDTQFTTPHTGMVYTPPSWSDHIAVSVVLDLQVNNVVLKNDAATRQTQPHKKQTCITSFLTKRKADDEQQQQISSKVRVVAAKTTTLAKKKAKPVSKNSILHHFRKKDVQPS